MKLKYLRHQVNRVPQEAQFEDQPDDKEGSEQDQNEDEQHQEEEQHPLQLEDLTQCLTLLEQGQAR